MIKALEEGKPVDLSKMPPPPPAAGGGGGVVHERALGSGAGPRGAAPLISNLMAAAAASEEPLPDLTQEGRSCLHAAFNSIFRTNIQLMHMASRLLLYL